MLKVLARLLLLAALLPAGGVMYVDNLKARYPGFQASERRRLGLPVLRKLDVPAETLPRMEVYDGSGPDGWKKAADAVRDPVSGIAVVTSGNAAIADLMVNWAASAALNTGEPPMKTLVIPLDEAGFGAFSVPAYERGLGAHVKLLHDSEALTRFAAAESLYGRTEYNAMARYKWSIAQKMLAAGAGPILVSDPDIVFLRRRPLSYISTMPVCDLTVQADNGATAHVYPPPAAAALGLLSQSSPHAQPPTQDWMVTGFFLLRPSPSMTAFIDAVLHWFKLSDHISSATDNPMFLLPNMFRDDQTLASMLLSTAYDLDYSAIFDEDEETEARVAAEEAAVVAPVGESEAAKAAGTAPPPPPPPGKSDPRRRRRYRGAELDEEAVGAELRRRAAAGECLSLSKLPYGSTGVRMWPHWNSTAMYELHAMLPQRLSLALLTPALFPGRVTYNETLLMDAALEPPFILHYNHMWGLAAKREAMKSQGHWFTDM